MRPAILLVLASLGLTLPASAQERSVTFLAHGGGFSALTDLDNSANPSNFKTGYNAGAAGIVQLNRYVGIRGDFTFARSELQDAGPATGDHFNKFF